MVLTAEVIHAQGTKVINFTSVRKNIALLRELRAISYCTQCPSKTNPIPG